MLKPGKMLAAVIVSIAVPHSHAQVFDPNITIDLPDISDFQPNTTRSLDLIVQNSGSAKTGIQGLDFYISVSGSGPTISTINLITGTLFESNNDATDRSQGLGTTLAYNGAATSSGTVSIPASPGTTKIATITFDSTGIAPGTYTYTIVPDPGNFQTVYHSTGGDFSPTTVGGNGQLTVVPEPSEYAAVLGLGCLGWAFASHKLKRSAA